jgi:hypothetical protein
MKTRKISNKKNKISKGRNRISNKKNKISNKKNKISNKKNKISNKKNKISNKKNKISNKKNRISNNKNKILKGGNVDADEDADCPKCNGKCRCPICFKLYSFTAIEDDDDNGIGTLQEIIHTVGGKSHYICEQCIKNWLATGNDSCPLCRTKMKEYGCDGNMITAEARDIINYEEQEEDLINNGSNYIINGLSDYLTEEQMEEQVNGYTASDLIKKYIEHVTSIFLDDDNLRRELHEELINNNYNGESVGRVTNTIVHFRNELFDMLTENFDFINNDIIEELTNRIIRWGRQCINVIGRVSTG